MFLESMIIGIHLGSIHVPQRDQNNVNPGIYFQTESNWIGGVYYNSLKRTSVYFGKAFEHRVEPFTLGIIIGGVTGYEDKGDRTTCWTEERIGPHDLKRQQMYCQTTHDKGWASHKIMPMGAPYIKFQPFKLTIIPAVSGKHSTVLHLSIEKQY